MSVSVFAADKFKFSFANEELTKMVETYSKATGQKFILDPGVRGKASILLPEDVTAEEAFNQLSTALAVNGFAISKRDDTMVIMSARNIQRSLIESYTDVVPPMKPERMVTYILTLQNVPAAQINMDLRILTSKDGELSVFSSGNSVIISDWASNIQRVAALLKELDKPVSANTAKFVAQYKKEKEKMRVEKAENDKKEKKTNKSDL